MHALVMLHIIKGLQLCKIRENINPFTVGLWIREKCDIEFFEFTLLFEKFGFYFRRKIKFNSLFSKNSLIINFIYQIIQFLELQSLQG